MFRRAHADILGALCGAIAHGLRIEKTLKLKTLPSMATFYRWLRPARAALWPKGTFAAAFDVNVVTPPRTSSRAKRRPSNFVCSW